MDLHHSKVHSLGLVTLQFFLEKNVKYVIRIFGTEKGEVLIETKFTSLKRI